MKDGDLPFMQMRRLNQLSLLFIPNGYFPILPANCHNLAAGVPGNIAHLCLVVDRFVLEFFTLDYTQHAEGLKVFTWKKIKKLYH